METRNKDSKMVRVVRKFSSHKEADKADRAYYRSLTGEQRVEILCELIDMHLTDEQREKGVECVLTRRKLHPDEPSS